MRVFALLALCFAAVAAVPANPQRIVGGSAVDISEYPSIVALLYSSTSSNYRQTCAGTIINNRSVLTAAHCTFGDSASRWRSRVGSTNANSGGFVYNTDRIVNHPNYNSNTYDSDIAIIRILANIIAQGIARPASIPNNFNPVHNHVVWAAGWGATSQGGSNVSALRSVQTWIINQNTCRDRFAEIGRTITANMLCSGWLNVGGADQCHGDSGGPLYHNRNIVVGVSSWGQGCGQARYPSVSTRVSHYTDWIRNNIW